ncbi:MULTISPECIES: ribonuclease toxin immunity protein CdiI [Xanthomonas]|uniref:ribonuclease toxin immunity protein CdiI n=1 Tax=Xanthomonas TaxID=338 RepID=UPI000E1E6652|nr:MULTISPECIES: ribonuclease toxin immunity protein CdiI [Xanthomonas]
MNYLYGQPYDFSDERWILKGYFDIIHSQGSLIEAAGLVVKRWGFSTDGAYCRFPDEKSLFEEDRFTGVEFCLSHFFAEDSVLIVSEREFFEFLANSLKIYEGLYPSESDKVFPLMGEARRMQESGD